MNLSHNQIEAIKNLNKLPELSRLDLSENNISELIGLEKLVNLREIIIDRNKIKTLDCSFFTNYPLLNSALFDDNIKVIKNKELLNRYKGISFMNSPIR